MDLSTPQRLPHSTSTHMSRSQGAVLSPAAVRQQPSTSSSIINTSTTAGPTPHTGSSLSLEAALAPHASYADPSHAALEAVLSERNALSSQNAQLWKLIEKQRSAYGQMLKDLERIRAERDGYKARLHPAPSPEARSLKSSSSTPRMNHDGADKERSGMQFSNSYSFHHNGSSRPGMERHQSEDPATPRKNALSPDNAQLPTLTPSRSQDHSRDRERSHTQPAMMSHSTSHTGNGGNRSNSTPSSSHQGHRQARPTPPPLMVVNGVDNTASPVSLAPSSASRGPSRQELASQSRSQSALNSAATSPSNIKPINFAPKTSTPSPTSGVQNPFENFIPNAPDPVAASASSGAVPKTSKHSASQSVTSLGPTGAGPGLIPPAEMGHHVSRDSRISLPDEARRYIANMGESPLASPALAHASHESRLPAASPQNGNGTYVATEILAEEDQEGDDRWNRSNGPSPHPFLDLEDDSSESEIRASEELDGERVESDSEVEGYEEMTPNRGNPNKSSLQAQKVRKAQATADQFPLPPATFVGSSSRGPASPTTPTNSGGHPNSNTANIAQINQANFPSLTLTSTSDTMPTPTTSMSVLFTPSGTTGPSSTATFNSDHTGLSGGKQGRRERDSLMASSYDPQAAKFRQMPLIDTDLKNATAQVVGSHIRANDKGKEVLSFVVSVNVVGKEGWIIEKFYSDVLALDSRLRQRCSRNTLKKIAPLPDNKLFKDHAPAKVDQRKQILQVYLQSIINLPIKDKNEILVFFSSDVMRERGPVTQSGYKEGYLTKRGKNFGGWKTRYFVLQGPVLEYYESRGGAHLGSITITGAQIGRQQKGGDKRDLDDENEYRHAFLIIEAKKGPAGQHPRHVLCAESDEERDSWVEVLVRYVMGSYNDDPGASIVQFGNNASNGPYINGTTPSSSSLSHSESTRRPPARGMSKDDISKVANPIPISQLSLDPATAKFFQAAPMPDELASPARSLRPSPTEPPNSAVSFSDSLIAKKILERGQASSPVGDEPLSSSLPVSSPLDAAGRQSIGQRANSELGHYPDLVEHQAQGGRSSSDQRRPRDKSRASFHPTLGTVKSSPTTERPTTPEPLNTSMSTTRDGSNKAKISGPLGGTPIPAGYKFGAKDPPQDAPPANNDRERKAKSRTFWGFGRQTNDKLAASQAVVQHARAVFGVSIQDSLAVAQIANLPAIAFRCIQYLEAKKADQEEGIYRLSGSSAVIKSLKDRFNAEGDIDLLASDEFWDPHAIAGLLKSFLRELPTSILTRDLHMRFLGVIDFVDAQERIKELSELISQLPLANYSLLRALTAHLILIVQNSHINKMTVRNVGIVFSPTLGIPAGVFSLMLGEFNRVFNVDGEGFDSPAEEEGDVPSPKRLSGLSRRNSRQYSDAAADQLLGLSGRSLPNMSATDEIQSDDGDEISVNGESGTEFTEADTEGTRTVESSADSSRAMSPAPAAPPATHHDFLHPGSTGSAETTPQKSSRISHVAASRGLNINVASDRRRSRMPPVGLPVSPRPFNRSPSQTPTSGTPQSNNSPVHTPSTLR